MKSTTNSGVICEQLFPLSFSTKRAFI